MFNFDDNDAWCWLLSDRLTDFVPEAVVAALRSNEPKYMEDAADFIYSAVGSRKAKLVQAVSDWIASQTVAAYHGSRLDTSDLQSIRENGLVALVPSARRAALEKKLAAHPQWGTVKENLEPLLEKLGDKREIGHREGQVHATLSRAGLLNGFNHYLTHGAEFDQHAAYRLMGNDGTELLARYGRPVLITLAVPGDRALKAANPFREIGGDIPNIVREVIEVWSYWLAYPDFSAASQRFDCGFIFYEDIPADWICNVEEIELPGDEISDRASE